MKIKQLLSISVLLVPVFLFCNVAVAEVNITPDIKSVELMHNGEKVIIQRAQDTDHKVSGGYDKTSRQCPPFCIQPGKITEGVETVTELEVLDYLKQASTDEKVMVIDTRTPDWTARGTIPGSVNIPWTKINKSTEQAWSEDMEEADADVVLTESLGVTKNADTLDFSAAKTLVLYCNGAWCGQSASFIKTLLNKGYPAEKLKWYRGGMQAWESLGLTTVPPKASSK